VKTDILRIFVTVTEKELAGVSVGKDAHVELDALPGRSVTGKVVRMAPTVDPATRTLDAEVQITNPTGELRPGMFGRGSIIVDTHPRAVTVPALAVQVTDGKRFVFVLDGDKARRRQVTTGVDEGTWLEVLSGVKEGEEIVTAGIDGLGDGSPVRVVRDVDPYTGAATPHAGPLGARTQADKPPTNTDLPQAKPAASRD
jgi:membrane fusion protein (multidrug efflux system)/multidrug efflux system membrane fusion protein